MRFIFKTDYDQDIRILKHSGYWYSCTRRSVFRC
jgi:branched-chain amino acid transport system permease protein